MIFGALLLLDPTAVNSGWTTSWLLALANARYELLISRLGFPDLRHRFV